MTPAAPAEEHWERALARAAAEHRAAPLRFRRALTNADRSTGAALSGELLRRRPQSGAPGAEPLVVCDFTGVAGQSFAAFLIPAVRFHLAGEANDYVAKGLSGGEVAIHAGAAAAQRGDVLSGNTVLYGATSGRVAIAGRAGERFAVRNSGALAVVEGVGQHGCEYMTAGVVIVLGPFGANFGAGMTGGLAYVPAEAVAPGRIHDGFLRPAPALEPAERAALLSALAWHQAATGSPTAARYLASPESLVRLEPLSPPVPPLAVWQSAAPWACASA